MKSNTNNISNGWEKFYYAIIKEVNCKIIIDIYLISIIFILF